MIRSVSNHIGPEGLYMLTLMFAILMLASTLFFIWGKLQPKAKLQELKLRTRSWWLMAVIFSLATLIHPVITFISIGFLSFFVLKELFSLMPVRSADKPAVFCGYIAIPVQYYFAFQAWYIPFLIFIPVVMYLWIPLMLVIQGDTKGIGRSMARIPASLMLAIFAISHMAFLLSLPEIPGFPAGGRGLLLFLVFITEINDVMQFIWGKLLGGRHKVLPSISPGKSWEGLIGGILSTSIIGVILSFLTPLSAWETLGVSFVLAGAGFVGDVIISAIKRDLGLKDTGTSIPGHGGILDRIDSLAVTAPVFFYLIYFLAY